MDGKHIRAFYANATAWSFDSDAEPHIVALREKQAAEFDAWLEQVRAEARREGQAEAFDAGWTARAEREPHFPHRRTHSAPQPPDILNPYKPKENRQ